MSKCNCEQIAEHVNNNAAFLEHMAALFSSATPCMEMQISDLHSEWCRISDEINREFESIDEIEEAE